LRLIALCLAWLAWLPAEAFPEKFSVDYVLSSMGTTIGRTELSLTPASDGGFVYESRSKATGLAAMIRNERIVERSEWRFHETGLRPLRYRYDRTGGKRERRVEVDFDWETGTVHNTAKGRTWRMSVPEGTLDKMIYLLALMQDLAAGRRPLEYSVADGGRLKTYVLEEIGEETLDTALGPMDTRVVRRLRRGEKRETILWCAPALAFLPVKVEHRERDGNTVTMAIDSVTGF
jgi:hypothetical protein